MNEDYNVGDQIQRNKFEKGETIEIMPQKGSSWEMEVEKMFNEEGEEVLSAPHPQQILKVKFSRPVKKYDILRKATN